MIGTETFVGKIGRNPQFEYRVENYESFFEFSLILFATLHAIIFVVLGFHILCLFYCSNFSFS